jgi:hypothetical protein
MAQVALRIASSGLDYCGQVGWAGWAGLGWVGWVGRERVASADGQGPGAAERGPALSATAGAPLPLPPPQVHPALAAVLAGLHEGGMLSRRRYEAVAGDVRLSAEIWKVGAALLLLLAPAGSGMWVVAARAGWPAGPCAGCCHAPAA